MSTNYYSANPHLGSLIIRRCDNEACKRQAKRDGYRYITTRNLRVLLKQARLRADIITIVEGGAI